MSWNVDSMFAGFANGACPSAYVGGYHNGGDKAGCICTVLQEIVSRVYERLGACFCWWRLRK